MTNTQLVHRWFDQVWNQGNEAVIDELMSATTVAHGLSNEPMEGKDAFRAFYQAFRAAFPKVDVTLDQILDTGDHVAYRARARVTHANGSGPFEFHGSGVIRVQNGRFVEGWNYWDFLSLLTQMGAIPEDAMERAMSGAGTV